MQMDYLAGSGDCGVRITEAELKHTKDGDLLWRVIVLALGIRRCQDMAV